MRIFWQPLYNSTCIIKTLKKCIQNKKLTFYTVERKKILEKKFQLLSRGTAVVAKRFPAAIAVLLSFSRSSAPRRLSDGTLAFQNLSNVQLAFGNRVCVCSISAEFQFFVQFSVQFLVVDFPVFSRVNQCSVPFGKLTSVFNTSII